LLSSRPGLGLEDPRGHLTKVLALAFDDKFLALALRKNGLGLGLNKSQSPLELLDIKQHTFRNLHVILLVSCV